MGFMKEFREFAIKGNVVDLAVGVIIGGAFKTIIDSVIADLVMPIVARIIGSPDFSNLYLPLKDGIAPGTPLAEARKTGIPIFAYGNFITVVINFLLLALVIFWMVKGINKLRRETPPPPPPAMSTTEQLLVEIRDALKK